jgi:hypothetical protein
VRKYAIKIGEIHVSAEIPISPELRKAMLKAVRDAMNGFDGDLGAGAKIEFRIDKA